MPLVNLQTNLKSLRYGYDRLGAGSTNGSNQPILNLLYQVDLALV